MDDLMFLLVEPQASTDIWEPGFEAGRHLVHARLGPIERVYLRPARFRQRFYHHLYPMPVDTWVIETEFSLFAGLCSVEVRLKLRFQATLRYAEKNPEAWDRINEHIRTHLEPLIFDVVEASLSGLESGEWIDEGLQDMEQRVATAINETLALNDIQGRALCSLKPVFLDPAEAKQQILIREEIVQAIIGKQLEAERLRSHGERQRREASLRQELDKIRFAAESSARKQSEEVEGRKRRLEARRRQMAELRQIEQQLHHETLEHQSRLEQMVLEKQRRDAQKRREMEADRNQMPGGEHRGSDEVMAADGETGQDHSKQDFGWEGTLKLREQERQIHSLEERLRILMSNQDNSRQMTVGNGEVSHHWLDRLGQWTGRLLFLIGMRR